MIDSEPYHLYVLLGVANTATPAEIKDGYRSQVKLKHPDVGGTPEEFLALVNAYTILSDAATRKEYDDNDGRLHADIVQGMQDVRGEALARMSGSFKSIVSKSDPSVLEQTDIILHMRNVYTGALKEAIREIDSQHSRIKALDKLIKRIRRNKVGENPFLVVLEEMKQVASKTATQLGYDTRVFNRVLDELDVYESPIDMMAGFGYTGGFSYSDSTSFGPPVFGIINVTT